METKTVAYPTARNLPHGQKIFRNDKVKKCGFFLESNFLHQSLMNTAENQ